MKQKEDFTLIQEKNLSSWQEFVDYCSGIPEGKFLFRGQSNYSDKLDRNPYAKNESIRRWELQSSFDRTYPKSSHNFSNFLSNVVREFSFKKYFFDYDLIFDNPKISKDLANTSSFEILQFFQHYGILTCLIDFTLDPLIALYFAVSTIKYESGGQSNEFPNCYFSIFQLNHTLLHEIVGTKYLNNSIEENSFRAFYNYYNFKRYIDQFPEYKDELPNYCFWSWIDIPDTFQFKWNKNLELQKGCFLLFESEPYWNGEKGSFEWMLEHFESVTGKKSKEPILTIFNIPYNSVFTDDLREGLYNGSLYEFLEKEKKLGKYLFNDLQGLKYDIQFRLSVM